MRWLGIALDVLAAFLLFSAPIAFVAWVLE